MTRRNVRRLVLPLLVLALAGCEHDVVRLTLVTGGEATIVSGELHGGALILLAGEAVVEAGGAVIGPTIVVGGTLHVAGLLDGDLLALGGTVVLQAGSEVRGDVAAVATLERHDAAHVGGATRVGPAVGHRLGDVVAPDARAPGRAAIEIAVATIAAFVASTLAPRATTTMADALRAAPVVAAATGALGLVVAIALAVVMAFTVVLLPFALFTVLLVALAVGYGWLALAAAVVGSVVRRGGGGRPPPAAIAIGITVLALASALLGRVPVVGTWLPLAVTIVGAGAVLLTGFGLRRFEPGRDVEPDAVAEGLPDGRKSLGST